MDYSAVDFVPPKRNLIHWVTLGVAGLYVIAALIVIVQPKGLGDAALGAVITLGGPVVVARWALRPCVGNRLISAVAAVSAYFAVDQIQSMLARAPDASGVLTVVFIVGIFAAGLLERRYRRSVRIFRGLAIARENGRPLWRVDHVKPNGAETLCALTNFITGENVNMNIWGRPFPRMVVVVNDARRVIYAAPI